MTRQESIRVRDCGFFTLGSFWANQNLIVPNAVFDVFRKTHLRFWPKTWIQSVTNRHGHHKATGRRAEAVRREAENSQMGAAFGLAALTSPVSLEGALVVCDVAPQIGYKATHLGTSDQSTRGGLLPTERF